MNEKHFDKPSVVTEPGILVLGIGNLLWADEGFGVRAVETLQKDWCLKGPVTLMDGGTQGLYLLDHVRSASHLVILDAVDYGLEPGTLKVVENEDVPRYLGARKMSLHQTGFQEVLALAQFTGCYPDEVVLIGAQPAVLDDYGGSLTPEVKACIEPALRLALDRLRGWGIHAMPRADMLAEHESVHATRLDIATYESQRPGPDEACRVGDGRFLPGREA